MHKRGFFERNLVEDRSLMFKTKTFGSGDQRSRSNLAKENVKQRREDEISKRRRMPLSTVATKNITANNLEKSKGKDLEKKKETKAADTRREKLLKWRKEKVKRMETQEKEKKKTFVVKHVAQTAFPGSVLLNNFTTKPVKKNVKSVVPKCNENAQKQTKVQTKRVTRSATSNTAHSVDRVSTRSQGMKTRAKVKAEAKIDTIKHSATKELGQKGRASQKGKCKGSKKQTTAVVNKANKTTTEKSRSRTTVSHDSDETISITQEKDMKEVVKTTDEPTEVVKTTNEPTEVVKTTDEPTEVVKTTDELTEVVKTTDEPTEVVKTTNEPTEVVAVLPKRVTRRSFAPDNFKFQPPTGVDSFQYLGENFTFKPLSPFSAGKFNCSSYTDNAVTTLNEEQSNAEEVKQKPLNDNESEELTSGSFRGRVEQETTRLQDLCNVWEKESENAGPALSEDVQGMIRTVIGQVQLLVTKKFKQFKGLIDLSEDPNAEKKTLVSDLQGFWEMIYFQVEDIDRKFCELDQLKKTDWVKEKKEVAKKTVLKKKSTRKPSAKKINASTNESRNRLREIRSQMKAKLREKNNLLNAPVTLYISPVKKLRLESDACTPDARESEEKKTPEHETCFENMTIITRGRSSEVKPDHNSAKKQNESAKKEITSEKKSSCIEGLLFDPAYLQPSDVQSPSVTTHVTKLPQPFLFTPVSLSQSELVTPTQSRLTKTPMPELTPTFNMSGVNSCAMNGETKSTEDNLIFFSPMNTAKTPCKEDQTAGCGSVRKFAQVTPSKKLESYFGHDPVFSPVRRSARLEQTPSLSSNQTVLSSLAELPDNTDYGYTPNKALILNLS